MARECTLAYMDRFLFAMLAALALSAGAEEPGIYADFVTSRGNFTARLDYGKSPKAVAAFVGLATGEKTWLDASGNTRHGEPFYDGTLFHRVLPGVAIQGGGVPCPSVEWTMANNGPDMGFWIDAHPFTVDIPPGGETNSLGEMPFVFTNAAAVLADTWFGGVEKTVLQTNYTYQKVWLEVSSSCELGTIIQTNIYRMVWVTNALREETTTECTVALDLALPNETAGTLRYTNSLTLFWYTTNAFLACGISTNFSNAGFFYPDAFSNGLVHTAGAVAMARSLPNTDGSQFFVCASNVPGWDGNYTVFGQVVSGMDVVTDLAATEVDGNDRPVHDLVLERVTIRRVGDDAGRFDIHAQGLPRVEDVPAAMVADSGQPGLSYSIPARSETMFRWTDDLLRNDWDAWQKEDWGYRDTSFSTNRNLVTDGNPQAFFHATAVVYPDAWTLPESHRGRSFTFRWTTTPETVERLEFSSSRYEPNTWSQTMGTNTISGQTYIDMDSWNRRPYSAELGFAYGYYTNTYTLRLDPGSSEGSFSGIRKLLFSNAYHAVSGTFTVDSPPSP